jgi:type I restriction enzyme R subunit
MPGRHSRSRPGALDAGRLTTRQQPQDRARLSNRKTAKVEVNTEAFFQELLKFSDALDQEEARSLSEGLTEEQLAVFDILMRPAPELTEAEKAQVKTVAEDLLVTLKRGKIVLDWRKEQNTRAAVRVAVEETLDRLPEKFTRQIYAQKCDAIYQHVFDSYWDDGHTVLRQGRMNPISCTPEGTPH